MSEITATNADAGTGGTPAPPSAPDFTPDVSDSSPQTPDAGGSFEPAASEPDYDKIFGLPTEPKQTDVPDQQDVAGDDTPAPATDEPAPHPGEDVETPQEPKPEDQQPKAQEPKATDQPQDPAEKLNFDSAPEHFRKALKDYKDEVIRLTETHPETQYLQDPQKFRDWMKETSPTSYQQVGQMLVNESVQAHPQEWASYLAETQPDALAQALTGKPDMTMDKLKGVLDLYDPANDDEDVQAALEAKKATSPPQETEEQKKVRELLERDAQREVTEAVAEISQPIISGVNQLVSQAGLEVDLDALQTQDFAKLDEDTQFKVFVNTMMPEWIAQRVQQNPQIAAMQARMEFFLSNKDEKGKPKPVDKASAAKLQHPLTIAITNFASEFLSIATTQKAKAKQKDTAPPTPTPPPPQVRSAGASTGALPLPSGTKLDWGGDPNKWDAD